MKKEEYELFKCTLCDLVSLVPQPTPEFLKEEIYSLKSGYQSGKTQDLSTLSPNTYQKKVLEFFDTQKKGSVLDVGCSIGAMMYFLKKRGFSPKGIELNKRTAETARKNGFEVFTDFLEKAPYPEKSFDYIFLGDVIEHVNDPREFLCECRRFLKDTGLIVIITPNLDCFWSKSTLLLWNIFGIPWSSVTPPHHLFQFSTDNLVTLLEQEHFTAKKIWYNHAPRLGYELGSLHLLRAYKKKKNLASLAKAVFGFALYILFYGIYFFVRPFLVKDNGIVVVGSRF